MERVDIAIIGTGPAGVSAALTATNRNKTVLLLGSRADGNKPQQNRAAAGQPGDERKGSQSP